MLKKQRSIQVFTTLPFSSVHFHRGQAEDSHLAGHYTHISSASLNRLAEISNRLSRHPRFDLRVYVDGWALTELSPRWASIRLEATYSNER